MNREEKLQYLGELLSCCHKLYLWCLDKELKLISSNCKEEAQIAPLMY